MDEKSSSHGYQNGAAGLQELEPSPVEESPMQAYKDDYFPPSSSTPSTETRPAPRQRTNTLGLSGHGPIYYLTRIQKYSSYAFTLFATFHIANTSLIPLATRSLAASDTYLLLTRPYYQSWPLAEPLVVVGPLAAHIASGVALRLYRRKQNLQHYGAETRNDRRMVAWPKLSGISALGYLLVPLVLGHALINRVIPLWVEGGSSSIGLEYVAHGFAKHTAVSWAGFTVLIATAAFHSTWGWAKWLGWTPEQAGQGGPEGEIRRKRRWYCINALSALIAAMWMAGGLGVVGRGGLAKGWLGKQYDQLYRHIPLFGQWI